MSEYKYKDEILDDLDYQTVNLKVRIDFLINAGRQRKKSRTEHF